MLIVHLFLIKPFNKFKCIFYIFYIASNIFLIILNIKNEFINVFRFSMKVLNFSAPSSPKILPTNFSAPSAILYPKSIKLIKPFNKAPAPLDIVIKLSRNLITLPAPLTEQELPF